MAKARNEKNRFLKNPYYEGGLKAMRTFIQENMKYPKEALQNKIEGTVYIKYDVNYKGKVTDAKIVSGIGHGCDEEAVRLVKMMVFKVPKNYKLRVLFHKSIQIHFRLPKQAVKPLPKPKAPTQQAPASVNYIYTTTKKVKKTDSKAKKSSGYGYTVNI